MIYSDSHFTLIHTMCGHFPVVFVMLCYGGDMRALMLVAHDLGMLNGDYAFLTVNLLPSAAIGNNTFMGNDGRDAEAALAFRGILSIYVREPTTELWRSFKEDVKDKMNAPPFQIQLDASEQVIHYCTTTPSCMYIKHHPVPSNTSFGQSNDYDSSYWTLPACSKPLFQNEAKCNATDMKTNFYSHINKTHFHPERYKNLAWL